MTNTDNQTQSDRLGLRRPLGTAISGAASAMLLAAACGSSASPAIPVATTAESQAISAAETTQSPSTSAPTPTEAADQSQVVAAAFQAQFVAWRSCTAAYDSCDPATEFADIYTGRALVNLTETVTSKQGMNRKNTAGVPDTDMARVDSVALSEDGESATVIYCSIDSRVVTQSDAAGLEVVVDDSVFHEQGSATLELGPDGVWRLAEFDVAETSSEVPICDG